MRPISVRHEPMIAFANGGVRSAPSVGYYRGIWCKSETVLVDPGRLVFEGLRSASRSSRAEEEFTISREVCYRRQVRNGSKAIQCRFIWRYLLPENRRGEAGVTPERIRPRPRAARPSGYYRIGRDEKLCECCGGGFLAPVLSDVLRARS